MTYSTSLPSLSLKKPLNQQTRQSVASQSTPIVNQYQDIYTPSKAPSESKPSIKFSGGDTHTGIQVSPAIKGALVKGNVQSLKVAGVKVGNSYKHYGQYTALFSPEVTFFKFSSMFGENNAKEFESLKKQIKEPIMAQIRSLEDLFKDSETQRKSAYLARAQYNLKAALTADNKADMKSYLQQAEQRFVEAKFEPANFESGIAAQVGLIECLKLLGKGAEAQAEQYEMLLNLAMSDTALQEAAKKAAEQPEAKEAMIKDLLYLQEHGALDIESISKAGEILGSGTIQNNYNLWTPLAIDAYYGNFNKVQAHLNRNTKDLNTPNRNGETPLYVAALNGHTEVVRTLLEAGANANMAAKNGKTPAEIASEKGHGQTAELIFKSNGFNINGPTSTGKTLLENAVYTGDIEAIKGLARSGADFRRNKSSILYMPFQSSDPYSAFAWNKDKIPLREAVIKALIEGGADPHEADIFRLLYNCEDKLAEYLIKEKGINIDKKKKGFDGQTHLCDVAGREHHADDVDFLLRHGANPNVADIHGNTPLHYAAGNYQVENIKLLLKHKANVNAKNKQGQTPLDLAGLEANVFSPESVQALKKAGGKYNKTFSPSQECSIQ